MRALAGAQHHLAVRAAGRHYLCSGGDSLGEALLGDPPLSRLLLLPELRAACAAAEGDVAALLHLDEVRAAGLEDLAGGVVLAVVPSQVAGVVERDAAGLGQRRQPALGRQTLDELRMVHDLVLATQLWVVVDEGVEAVRAG